MRQGGDRWHHRRGYLATMTWKIDRIDSCGRWRWFGWAKSCRPFSHGTGFTVEKEGEGEGREIRRLNIGQNNSRFGRVRNWTLQLGYQK